MPRKCLDCGSTNVWCDGDMDTVEVCPPYLVRPEDFEVFSLNDDGRTYSSRAGKIQFPHNYHHKYSYVTLVSKGFFFVKGLNLEK